MNATYEMQFGSVERPTHFNTLADLAKYEVPGHKWADLSEHGFGVALLSESKYGWSTCGNVMRLSLLRAPSHPDPTADRCVHEFAYAIMPHKGNWRDADVVAEGYKFNSPLLLAPGLIPATELVSVDNPNLVIDTVKRAEDSDALIIRLYECHGARGDANLTVNLPFKRAEVVDILEQPLQGVKPRDGRIPLRFSPYQVISLMIR
jgi:alpha-mannosidase